MEAVKAAHIRHQMRALCLEHLTDRLVGLFGVACPSSNDLEQAV